MKKEVKVQKEYLSPKDAAKVLGMSVRHLLNTAHNYEIPFYYLNARVVRFERHDLESFMESRRIEAVMY